MKHLGGRKAMMGIRALPLTIRWCVDYLFFIVDQKESLPSPSPIEWVLTLAHMYIYTILYLEPMSDLFFGRLTFHFMGQIFQNMSYLGYR